MTDPFRGGGFGSIGFGPFNNGGTDFGRYNIADDGDNVALTRKYSAQLAWANGTITDAAYLRALDAYRRTTDKGSRERMSADNEYEDAVYTIGRNKIVRQVNQASSTTYRVSALRRLIAYDRRKLGTMVGDNEQARELRDRIADAEGQVREVRYSDMVRRFNADSMSLEAMLRYARNAAAGSRGGPDHETWLSRVREWSDRIADEKLNQLYQDYEHERIPGSTILDFLKGRMAEMSPDSPAYADTQRTIEDLTKRFKEDERSKEDAAMASRVQRGTVSIPAYLRYLHGRINDYGKGTSERRSAEDEWMQATFSYGEQNLRSRMAMGDATTGDLVGFYRGYMATMEPGSARFLELQAQVSDLLVQGTQAIALIGGDVGGGYVGGGGRWVSLTGAPGGTPVNAKGFASQFDGSAFGSSNCGMASAAMMAWAASGGKIRVSGGDLRYYSGDRDQSGDEKGTTYDDIALAFQQVGLGLKQYHGMDFTAWKRRLLSGEGSLISGHYMDAPVNLRLTNGASFTHTMYVDRAKKDAQGNVWFFVMDPLGRSGYTGQWWPEAAMKQYGWSGRANAGGGQWMGDVAFAAGKGRSGTYINPDREAPRFQAFDTDADGRSTVGRGGGTSRQEAGRRRDWSKGRQAEAPTSWPQYQLPASKKDGVIEKGFEPSDEQIGEFLAAVDSVERPSLSDPTSWGASARPGVQGREGDRRARAKAILGEWNGDARLAAVAWFTGSVTPDTASWDATQRFYANAIGTRLGYAPVGRTSQIAVGGSMVTLGETVRPMPAPGTLDMTTVPQDTFAQRDDLTPQGPGGRAAADIGTMLLRRLGVEPTPDMVRAVAAWMQTTGDKVVGNNPGSLLTMGVTDLPGQVTKDSDSRAVFGSLDEGVAAWAAEIERSAPQIVAAARTGDAERFLVAVDRSGWVEGGYGGALVRTYNELPGDHPKIIGGLGRMIQPTANLRGLSRSVPSIAELFDIDPRDPVQMDWLELNVQSAKEARESGADQWTFTTPGGQQVTLDFAPGMASDLTGTKATYLDWVARADPTDFDASRKATAAWKDHNLGVARVMGDEWRNHVESLDRLRQAALGTMDFRTYRDATFEIADITKVLLGQDPAAPLDPESGPNKQLLKDAGLWDDVIRWGDRLDPRDTSSGDLSTMNDQGDRVMEAFVKGRINPDGSINPAQAYVAWKDDGTLELVTVDTDQDAFAPSDVPVTMGGRSVSAPAYVNDLVQVTMEGRTGYIAPRPGKAQAVVLTAAGYRESMAPVGPLGVGAAPGSTTPLSGKAFNPTSGLFKNPPVSGGMANVSSWLMGPQQGRSTLVTVAGTDDRMVASVGVMLDVGMIRLQNPRTHRMWTWYSVPGSNEWLGGEDSFGDKAPPRLVLGDGATVQNGRIVIDGEDYDSAKHGELTRYVHWYGTRPTDGARGSLGADGSYWRLRRGTPGPGGGVSLDSAPPDPLTAFLEGDVPITDILGGALGRVPRRTAPTRFEKDDLVALTPAASRAQADARNAAGVPADFEQISRNLATAGLFSSDMPMTAGSRQAPPRSMLPTFISRVSAGVKAGAQVALDVASAQQQLAIAQQQQAERLARLQAAQRAQQQQASMAAQIAEAVQPKPAAKPAPGTPQPKAPAATPPKPPPPPVKPPVIPTPKGDGRTKPLDGGV